MRGKLFVNIVANAVLVVVILAVSLVVFGGGVTSVFNKNDYSPIYRGNGENCVSLMINVYWGNEYLEEMLQILAKHNVKCTFFVGGSWAAKYPEMLKAIADGGHEIGNHGYFHKEHSKLTYLKTPMKYWHVIGLSFLNLELRQCYLCHQVATLATTPCKQPRIAT